MMRQGVLAGKPFDDGRPTIRCAQSRIFRQHFCHNSPLASRFEGKSARSGPLLPRLMPESGPSCQSWAPPRRPGAPAIHRCRLPPCRETPPSLPVCIDKYRTYACPGYSLSASSADLGSCSVRSIPSCGITKAQKTGHAPVAAVRGTHQRRHAAPRAGRHRLHHTPAAAARRAPAATRRGARRTPYIVAAGCISSQEG